MRADYKGPNDFIDMVLPSVVVASDTALKVYTNSSYNSDKDKFSNNKLTRMLEEPHSHQAKTIQ